MKMDHGTSLVFSRFDRALCFLLPYCLICHYQHLSISASSFSYFQTCFDPKHSPLLAAANVLLLKKLITLPSTCMHAGVVTIDELTNVLFEKILSNNSTSMPAPTTPTASSKPPDDVGGKAETATETIGAGDETTTSDNKHDNNDHDYLNPRDHHIQEVLQIFPSLQYGMDVNPRFDSGPTGMEYTKELNAFDLLHIELVHGWLLDPTSPDDEHMLEIIGSSSYNELVDHVITGNDAMTALEQNPNPYAPDHDDLSTKATKGSIIRSFLESSGHQLTQYGLQALHEYVREGDMKIFFRNNHFNALTKHSDGHLYLLVTDIGFADLPLVVFEKLDVIDGDTEYVTGNFQVPPPMPNTASSAATGEQLLSSNPQSQADYQLALQLSQENGQVQQQQLQQERQQQQQQQQTSTLASTLVSFLQPAPPKAPSTVVASHRRHADSDLEKALQASLLDQQQMYDQQKQQQYQSESEPAASINSRQPSVYGGTTVAIPPRTSASENMAASSTSAIPPVLSSHDNNSILRLLPPQSLQPHPTETSEGALVVALGIPVTNLSQEDRDMMLAMQLQRQEEQERQSASSALAAGNNDEASLQLAQAIAQEEQARHHRQQQQRVAAAGPPPNRQPTAMPVGGSGGRRTFGAQKDNCIIS